MKAVAYLRVSTKEQDTDRQIEDIYEYLKNNKGIELVEVFEDKISGSKKKKEQRKGFTAMEYFIDKNDDIKHILTLEVSRLGRRSNEVSNIVQHYLDRGINIHFIKQNLRTIEENGSRSSMTALMVNIISAIAQTETETMGKRISSGKLSKAKKNLAFGGKIIGYKKGDDGTPVIDEKDSKLVHKVFELASKGMGMRNISAMIETEFDRKIPIGTLGGIIRNTFHKGLRKYNDISLTVPAIVSDELWEKANDFIDSRKKFTSGTNVNTNIIQGKINCYCGNVMHQKVLIKGRINNFTCKDVKCKNTINRPWLFRMIRKVVERHDEKIREEKVRDNFKLQLKSKKSKIEVNSKSIEKSKRRLKRVLDVFLDEDITKEEYLHSKEKSNKEIDTLTNENNILNNNIKSLEYSLKNKLGQLSKDLEIFKVEIQDIIHRVIIHNDYVSIGVNNQFDYDLDKPNSKILGWEARKPIEKRYLNEKLPLRQPISYVDLEIMINSDIAEKDGTLDAYFDSDDYKEKEKKSVSLGGKGSN